MKKFIFILLVFIMSSCDDFQNNDAINGLMPVDVYMNMEKEGFTTTQTNNTEGNLWINKKTTNDIIYTVSTFSKDATSVETVEASVFVTASKKIEATMQFLKFVSTLPYENSDPVEAASWIENIFFNDNSSIIIGDAKLTLYCPTQYARTLLIKKNK